MPTTSAVRPPLDPKLFGNGPARDDRFTVVEVWANMVNLPEGHPDKEREFLNRQMNEEACVMENAARSLAEFPEADWGVRKGLARQCADEARHVLNYRRLLEARGGRVGQYPVMNFQYRILGKIDTLVGRLAVQNRSFEADGLDAATFARDEARARGDDELADMYDAQQADEVCHIRLGNDTIKAQIPTTPRVVLHIATALTQAAQAFAQVFAGGGTEVEKYGIAVEARLEAGFSQQEVDVAVRMSDERRAAVRERAAG
ncbi:MAG: DUF455 family protein, partial [Gemmatimonadales bacterium]